MQIVFEVRESLSDAEYMKLVGKISEVNANKDTAVEYPSDVHGVNSVVTASPQDHINNLKRKYRFLVDKYTKETTRYMKIIADLSEDNIKLRKEAEEWEDDIEDDD